MKVGIDVDSVEKGTLTETGCQIHSLKYVE